MQYDLSELKKKCDFKENIYNATMSYHHFQIFEKIGTEESHIDTSIELSERVNLSIKQNTYIHLLSNSPNDFLFSCANISPALFYFDMPLYTYTIILVVSKTGMSFINTWLYIMILHDMNLHAIHIIHRLSILHKLYKLFYCEIGNLCRSLVIFLWPWRACSWRMAVTLLLVSVMW